MADQIPENIDTPREMSFFDHLEELRWRIIKAVGAVIVTSIICGFFSDYLVQDVLLGTFESAGAHAVRHHASLYGSRHVRRTHFKHAGYPVSTVEIHCPGIDAE